MCLKNLVKANIIIYKESNGSCFTELMNNSNKKIVYTIQFFN